MYKNVLSSIPGIEFYPIVALLLFFGFFVALLGWFFLADKKRLSYIAETSIEDGVARYDLNFGGKE